MEKKKLGGLVLKVGKQLVDKPKPKRRKRSKQVRKVTGKEAADLQTPATVATPRSGQALKSGGPEANVGGVRKSAQIKKEMDSKGKTLTAKIKELEKLKNKNWRKSPGGITAKTWAKHKEDVERLENAIAGMKKRGVTPKRGGGKVVYRSIGGKVLDGNDITRMIYD